MQTNQERKKDVYSIVTDRIIEQLEKGKIPWRKPWTEAGIPRNLISGKAYKGINVFLLASLGYAHNFFLTENQLGAIGATKKEDEIAHIVVFWKWKKDDEMDDEENEKTQPSSPIKPIIRFYKVFNVAQCNGIQKSLAVTEAGWRPETKNTARCNWFAGLGDSW